MTTHILHDINVNYFILRQIVSDPIHPLNSLFSDISVDEFRELWLPENIGIDVHLNAERLKVVMSKLRHE